MAGRHRDHFYVVRLLLDAEADVLRDGDIVAVGQDDAFALAGGAGGEEHFRDVIRNRENVHIRRAGVRAGLLDIKIRYMLQFVRITVAYEQDRISLAGQFQDPADCSVLLDRNRDRPGKLDR